MDDEKMLAFRARIELQMADPNSQLSAAWAATGLVLEKEVGAAEYRKHWHHYRKAFVLGAMASLWVRADEPAPARRE